MKGIKLKPIRLRNSLYLLIPMEVAKLIGVTKGARFILTLDVGEKSVLIYKKMILLDSGPNPSIDRLHALITYATVERGCTYSMKRRQPALQ